MLQALRVRDFRLLWSATLVSGLGSWLLVIAAPAHVLATTDSLLATGLVVAAEYLPFLLLGPIAGVLADRMDRRMLLICTDLFRAAAIALLFTADTAPWTVHVAVLLESAATVIFTPAMQAHLPAVVGTGLLRSANALNAIINGTVRLVGGPLGAALLLTAGFPVLVAIDIATYLLSAIAIIMTRKRGRPNPRGDRSSFRAGLQVLPEHPVVAALLPATGVFLVANAALSALLVPLGVQHLGGPTAIGTVLSALGVGFLLGAPLLRLLVDRIPIRLLLSSAQAMTAAGFAVLVNATALPLALMAAAVIGMSGSVVLGAPRTVWQRTVPGSALGRISAVFGIIEAAAILTGAVLGPILAQITGLSIACNTATLLAVAGAVMTAVIVPSETTPKRSIN
ncbi:MFS transporter [Pseudonocardia alaniniphila]|uniref:MFS transporter n=1 Tax=Pseudonocardia alaniniphila TaxID=75291 RepID=A0ABS9TMJ7_9PSEU|nr:MFS transporter [Pseudonocardia alaniniphila]MCH6169764.1 MFS transporter [Pseudonocardia alaniniphila]